MGVPGRAVLYYWVQSLFGWTDLKISVEQLVRQCPVFQQTQGEQQFSIGPLHESSMGGYFFNSLYRYAVLVLAVSMIKGNFQHWVAAWIQQRAADSSVIKEGSGAQRHCKHYSYLKQSFRHFHYSRLYTVLDPCLGTSKLSRGADVTTLK